VVLGGRTYQAFALWGYTMGAAGLLTVLLAPVLGATADFSASKRRFLLTLAWAGSLTTVLFYFAGAGDVWLTMLLLLVAQVCFVGANVFYDAFLPLIASEEKMDWVSGKGYAYGYVGGGVQFGLALLLVAGHERLGMEQATAARIAIAMAGLWWAGFTLVTARYLKEPGAAEPLPARYAGWPRPAAYLNMGLQRTLATTRNVARFKHLLLFLFAYVLYNNGIQTVILMATLYGAEELKLKTTHLLLTLLIIQLIATGGALLFGKIAQKTGSKRAVMLSLAMWSGVVVYAYFIDSATEYFLLGVAVGLVLGGSQALSRSLYSSMVPLEASAEFFGFYSVFTKLSAVAGPIVLAVIQQVTQSARLAILSLIVFFVLGLVLLWLVDEEKAREARREGEF
jgi:UMF1 family MFS transporter